MISTVWERIVNSNITLAESFALAASNAEGTIEHWCVDTVAHKLFSVTSLQSEFHSWGHFFNKQLHQDVIIEMWSSGMEIEQKYAVSDCSVVIGVSGHATLVHCANNSNSLSELQCPEDFSYRGISSSFILLVVFRNVECAPQQQKIFGTVYYSFVAGFSRVKRCWCHDR